MIEKLPSDWVDVIGEEFNKEYMKNLSLFLKDELTRGKKIYPHGDNIFEAFHLTPFSKVKVVILGQDPYHGPGQAHGLSFSVKKGIDIPPSLINIYKELCSDLGYEMVTHGNLSLWAKEGVLLLNNVLTVEHKAPGSHKNKGWEIFTDAVVNALVKKEKGLAFILWGSQAQKKGANINKQKHFIIRSPHPSPLSSYRGFFGSKPFSQVNKFLIDSKQNPVNWKI